MAPHNLEAEVAVLGCVLLEGRTAYDQVVDCGLRVEDFYLDAHRRIFDVMVRLVSAERAVDVISVNEEFRRAGEYGVAPRLAHLIEQAAILSHIDAYAGIVIDLCRHRELVQVATAAVGAALRADRGVDEVLADLEVEIGVLRRRTRTDAYDPARPWARLVERWGRGSAVLHTRLDALDTLTGGHAAGQIVIVGGLRGFGKTAFMCDRAIALAQAGARVEILALEETEEDLTRRLVARLSEVPIARLRDGRMPPADFARAQEAVTVLQALPLRVRDVRSLHGADELAVSGAVASAAADVVMVDHLGKVDLQVGKNEIRPYAVKRVLDRWHLIAQRRGLVLWVNNQVSRDGELRMLMRGRARGAWSPLLSDLADSSAVEQVARQVLILVWPWKAGLTPSGLVADLGYDPEVFWVFVAKNSEGATGKVAVRFRPAVGQFVDEEVV